jgi:polyphenol oxidase
MTPLMFRSALLEQINGITHGFTSRRGGVSVGPFSSLNLGAGVNDNPDAVRDNRQRALKAVGCPDATWISLAQVHGRVIVQASPQTDTDTRADGLCTAEANVALAVLAADCVPILMAEKNARAVGAAHAGWRGTCFGIGASLVSELGQFGHAPSSLLAAIGPAIGPCCFEIGPEVVRQMREVFGADSPFITSHEDGKGHADLWELNKLVLVQSGIPENNIDILRLCTVCDSRFYSHRRDAGITGRQAGVIALIPPAPNS